MSVLFAIVSTAVMANTPASEIKELVFDQLPTWADELPEWGQVYHSGLSSELLEADRRRQSETGRSGSMPEWAPCAWFSTIGGRTQTVAHCASGLKCYGKDYNLVEYFNSGEAVFGENRVEHQGPLSLEKWNNMVKQGRAIYAGVCQKIKVLKNDGESCLSGCGGKAGLCESFCGNGGACCRMWWAEDGCLWTKSIHNHPWWQHSCQSQNDWFEVNTYKHLHG